MGIDPGTLTKQELAGWSSSGSSGSTQLPSWAQSYLQSWIGNMQSPAWTNYQKSLEALNNSNTFIDQQRDLMNAQYRRDIQAPTQNAVGNAMNQFAQKKTGGSSMAGDWWRNFAGVMNQGAAKQQNAANQWAAQSKLGMLGQTVNANQNFAQMMSDLLGLGRVSTQESSSYSQGAFPAGQQGTKPGGATSQGGSTNVNTNLGFPSGYTDPTLAYGV